jgi:CRP-like cAMP-binding protein
MADSDCRLSRSLLDITVRQLGDMHARLTLLGRKTAEEKLASFMLEMMDRTGRVHRMELSMSRADIADYLGLTVETVCRVLSAFKRERMIAMPNPHRIQICDREALEAMREI